MAPPAASGKGAPHQRRPATLRDLDYSIVQQCMHCGMCLPTCPTYVATGRERHSPRGRIALMRAVADGELAPTRAFADEMYYCLGCLACVSACPAGVDYPTLFEHARAEAEASRQQATPGRDFWRGLTLRGLFLRPRLLRLVGRGLWLWQRSGAQAVFRWTKANQLLPPNLRRLEPQAPRVRTKFSPHLIRPWEQPPRPQTEHTGAIANLRPRYRVGLLTGCVQDLLFSDVNRATAEVLLANGCAVFTPPVQPCCGSLHAHNGDLEAAATLARRMLDLFPVAELDAIITNAGGCGSHLKHYHKLLAHDAAYADRAAQWDAKAKDIHEWLVEIGFRAPRVAPPGLPPRVTYHESCHLCHGQKITRQPRAILQSIPGLTLVELPESNWCCGSAGIYNITQPEMAGQLSRRKVEKIASTGTEAVLTSNPGCHLQLTNGLREAALPHLVSQPVLYLAAAYRAEAEAPPT